MMNHHILIVEDEIKIAELLSDYLKKAGHKVSLLGNGEDVIPYVKQDSPDLILLDIMLPGMDGMKVCRELRKFSDIPIIMITARVEELDRLIGLELGADDYICKPFSPREVVARVKAVMRRINTSETPNLLEGGPISVDIANHEVTINDQALTLTPSELGLLKTLMANPNRVFSRNELLNQVLGYNYEGYDRTIDTHIKNLRKKISVLLPDQEVISAVYGVGYRYISPPE